MPKRKYSIRELDLDTIRPTMAQMYEPSSSDGGTGGLRVTIIGRPGSGKCLSFDTEILNSFGEIVKVQDVKIGDKLMGDDSKPRNVLGVTKGRGEMFEIKQRNDSYNVNSEHVLSLVFSTRKAIRDRVDRNSFQVNWFENLGKKSKDFSYKILSKEEVYIQANDYLESINEKLYVDIPVKEYLQLKPSIQVKLKGYRVGVEFPNKSVFDPYIIGLWLGDGTSSNSGFTSQDSTILHYLANELPKYDCYLQSHKATYQYRMNGDRGNNYVLNTLRKYNLLNNKHIPKDYKINSRVNRLKLLAGIIDSDGHLQNNGYEIAQKSKVLSDDIVFLCRSLGFRVNISHRKKGCTNNGEYFEDYYYIIGINGEGLEEIPVLCPRKKANGRLQIKNALRDNITVTPIGVDDYYGFELDGNHRFLLGNFIVTHNSTLIKNIIHNKKKVIPEIKVYSGTEDVNHFYERMIDKCYIEDSLNETSLGNFIEHQKIKIEHLKDENNWSLLIIDDLTSDKTFFNKPIIQQLYKLGRHYKMLFILVMHYSLDIRPSIRSATDGVFIMREPNPKFRKSLWENYAGVIPTFKEFNDFMDILTDDYCCIYIDNTSTSNKVEECVYYFKATPIKYEFKFGSDTVRLFANNRSS